MLSDLFTSISVIDQAGNEVNLNDLVEYVFDGSDGFGMAPFHRITERGSLQHGETDIGFRLDPRILKFKLKARGATPAGLYERREELLSTFCPRDDNLVLKVVLPSAAVRYLDCHLEAGLKFPTKDRNNYVHGADIVLRAPDPAFYDPTQQVKTYLLAAQTQLVFPITFPITLGSETIAIEDDLTYAGSWIEYPLIEITGPILDPGVENLTKGEKLLLDYQVGAGEMISIDCRYGYKTIVNNYGLNLASKLSTDSDLARFHLEPAPVAVGGVNELKVTGTEVTPAVTSVVLRYYKRYIGI